MPTAETAVPNEAAIKPAKWKVLPWVFVLLTALNLATIATGIGMWRASVSSFGATLEKLGQSTVLVQHFQALEDHTSRLTNIAEELFHSNDVNQARLDLDYLQSSFALQFSREALLKKLAHAGSQQIQPNSDIGSLLTHFSDSEVILFSQTDAKLTAMIGALNRDVAAYSAGTVAGNSKETLAARKDYEATRQRTIQEGISIAGYLDNLKRKTSTASQALAQKSIFYQYALAAVLLTLACLSILLATVIHSFFRTQNIQITKSQARASLFESDLHTAHEQIATLNAELLEKMSSLKLAQDELGKKGRMEQLGQLTATVAHELRNPLGGVRTSAYLLERKLAGKGMGAEQSLQRINNGILRCDKIITQLLDFSRTAQVRCEMKDLDQWLKYVIEEEAKTLPSNIRIKLSLGMENQFVPFDPARLQRAVINLLSNASEAMVGRSNDEPVDAVESPEIDVSTFVSGDKAMLRVRDNGPGIPPDVLARIREPLFTTKNFGTGLGIPAVEQIAVQHGGTLEIKSSPGDGAEFMLILPLNQPARSAA